MAAAMGYTAEDTAEALGLMANAGIKGSTAGTSLRTALTNLANPTAAAKSAMKELGIEAADAEGNMLPLDDVMGQLRESFKGLSEEEQAQAASAIFGKRAMSGMLAVINATDDDISKLADATTNYNGVVEEQADIMQSGAKGGLLELKSAVEELAIKISDVLLPAFKKIIEKVQGFVDKLNALSPEQQKTILKILGIAAAIGPVLMTVGKMISVFGKAIFIFKKIGGAFKAFSGVLGFASAGPLALIILGIAALVAIGIILYKNWDAISAWLIQAWTSIKEFAVGIWTSISEFFIGLWTSIKTAVTTAWTSIKEFFSNIWSGIAQGAQTKFEGLKTFFENIWLGITMMFQYYAEIFRALFSIFTSILQGDWQGAWETIKTLFSNAWTNIKNVLKVAVDLILSIFGTSLEELKTKVKEKIDKIKEIFENLKEKIKGILDKIREMWKNFKLPTFTLKTATKTFLGKTITFPTGFSINWMADGGIFTKPTLLGHHGVGEAGKEAVLPLNRLPGLLGLDDNQPLVVQVILGDEIIEEYFDNRVGRRVKRGF